MRSLLFLGLALQACSGKTETPEPKPEPEAPEIVDTGWPPGDIANIHIAYHENFDKLDVFALFTESAPSFINFAQCAIAGTTCYGAFAEDEDDYEDYDAGQDLEREDIITRFAGFDIEVGPYTLPYREDPDTKFGFYYSNGSDPETGDPIEPPFDSSLGVQWAGQWEEYSGEDDLFVPKPFELIAPPAGSNILFTNNEIVPFEWVPTGEGVVTLSVSTAFSLSRLYLLEDDGYFGLDVDDLGLLSDSDDLTFQFTRWNQQTLHKFGHVVELLATSDTSFTGKYIQIGSRVPIEPADECPQAQGSLPLQAGGWWGFLAGEINSDYTVFSTCIGQYPASSNGPDGVFRVHVEPKHAFTIDYNLLDASASVYFAEDCNDPNDTCVIGRDVSPDINIHEYLQVFNPDDDTEVLYLVIDSSDTNATSVFTLDVTDEELFPPPMFDTCVDAQLAEETLTSGTYYTDFVSYTDNLNPGDGGCTASSLTGTESLIRVQLEVGQSMTANVNMPGGDVGLYVLYNCLDAFSCPAGSDVGGTSAAESISYTNYSSGPESVYLVVDSKGVGLRPYFLEFAIN